jgi:hypothetical protein
MKRLQIEENAKGGYISLEAEDLASMLRGAEALS